MARGDETLTVWPAPRSYDGAMTEFALAMPRTLARKPASGPSFSLLRNRFISSASRNVAFGSKFDAPLVRRIAAPRLAGGIDDMITVVGLHGGSRVAASLSTRGLTNVRLEDSRHDFTFIVGGGRYRCLPSAAQFLSPRVRSLHSIDATIDEIAIDVDDATGLFGAILDVA
jgi:hypothetical protein